MLRAPDDERPRKNIGDALAQRIEDELGLPPGAMVSPATFTGQPALPAPSRPDPWRHVAWFAARIYDAHGFSTPLAFVSHVDHWAEQYREMPDEEKLRSWVLKHLTQLRKPERLT